MGKKLLRQSAVRNWARDAELLLAVALERDRAFLIAHPERTVSAEQRAAYVTSLERRAAGVPMQYVLGCQEFWGRDFRVTPDVLIPRPETELIIEHALRLFANQAAEGGALRCADIGTGSGCLAVTLACELRGAEIVATDISEPALAVARANAAAHGVAERIEFLPGDLGQPLLERNGAGSFQLLVSNPPYGGTQNAEIFDPEVLRNEPHEALFGGDTGTETIGRLLPQACELLGAGGVLLLEIGVGQAGDVAALLGGAWEEQEIYPDLQGIPRCVFARKAAAAVGRRSKG